jgi:hypothetical protein
MMREDDERRLARLIAAADWRRITPRLFAFAWYCLSRQGRGTGPRDKSPGDYVTKAVYEVLNGQHSPHKLEDLFPILSAVVAMHIRNDSRP